jgi:hypothetical protein
MPSIDYDQLNLLAASVHQNALNKGCHNDEIPGTYMTRLALMTANMHRAVSSLWETACKGQLNEPCDKEVFSPFYPKPRLTCVEEDLADIVIRALDTAATLGVSIGECVKAKHEYNQSRPHMHGGKLA